MPAELKAPSIPGKLWACAACARRTGKLQETATGVQVVLMFLPERANVERAGLEAARSIFSPMDEWGEHFVSFVEIPPGFRLDEFVLDWTVHR